MKFQLSPSASIFLVSALLLGVLTSPALAQELKSAAPAKELAELLSARKLDSIAARMPDDRETVVGALAFPGQLMVIWAKTTAPAVMNEKLIRKDYRDVYIDLNSASIVETRQFVTDLGADGLRVKPQNKQAPADTIDRGAKSLRFDGNWKEDKMSEADYLKAHGEADAAYAMAVSVLLAELKKPS
jgi:hypothetical protein